MGVLGVPSLPRNDVMLSLASYLDRSRSASLIRIINPCYSLIEPYGLYAYTTRIFSNLQPYRGFRVDQIVYRKRIGWLIKRRGNQSHAKRPKAWQEEKNYLVLRLSMK